MERHVFLFVDTNLFFQCRALEELDWSEWVDYEAVHLIVSSPVLREVDYRKKQGNDRVGKRARKASERFRDMLGKNEVMIRGTNPCITLHVEAQHTYDGSLSNQLDYNERDDQLVGTAYLYAKEHPERDVQLLTDDTIVLYKASGLGLKIAPIPDRWLLAPELDERDKQITKLQTENNRLRKAEPAFSFRTFDEAENEIERYHSQRTRFQPLGEDDVETLFESIKRTHPMVTDFDTESSTITQKSPSLKFNIQWNETYEPPSPESIAKYQTDLYPAWLDKCRERLEHLHEALEKRRETNKVWVAIANTGTRPADDALITFIAHGNFLIKPPDYKSDEEQEAEESSLLKPLLPHPPDAPKGTWKHEKATQTLARDLARIGSIRGLLGPSSGIGPGIDMTAIRLAHQPSKREPNSFYYTPDRPYSAQERFSLECEQWRHAYGEEKMLIEIHAVETEAAIQGKLDCIVQAANLSDMARFSIPVRISLTSGDTIAEAKNAIAVLCGT
ncbi:PIN domain-containing protein [Ponticaulis koreensis]|uniref:PIN domain-containing protein n=1 Tax=Ponticaulis koreensis TaxID=1123045 RepID=UPI0009DBCB90|nr:PIN domain-containing protein [Ponticaulis koreensis]